MELVDVMKEKFGAMSKDDLRIVIAAMNPCKSGIKWFDTYAGNDVIGDCRLHELAWFSRPFLSGVDLSGANLCGVNLRWADLMGVRMLETNLYSAYMERCNLAFAKLCGSDLSHVCLSYSDLYHASLSNCDLSNATLRGCDVRGTRFDGANLRTTEFSDAIYNDNTVFPHGFEIPTNMVNVDR